MNNNKMRKVKWEVVRWESASSQCFLFIFSPMKLPIQADYSYFYAREIIIIKILQLFYSASKRQLMKTTLIWSELKSIK